MSLPMESLREYYRERVNPFYNAAVDSERDFKPYTPCTPGSRWRAYVFMLSDNRKQVQVAAGKIFVDGKFRSDIRTGLLGSRWSGHLDDHMFFWSGSCCELKESECHCWPRSWQLHRLSLFPV